MLCTLFETEKVNNNLNDHDDQRLEGYKIADEVDHVAVEKVRLLENQRREQRSGIDL